MESYVEDGETVDVIEWGRKSDTRFATLKASASEPLRMVDVARDVVQELTKPNLSVIAQEPTKLTYEAELELNGSSEAVGADNICKRSPRDTQILCVRVYSF